MGQYWVCIIGPVDRIAIPKGGDYPMRMAVREAFKDMIGIEDDNCWSGWGTSEKRKEALMKVWNKEITNENKPRK